MLLQRGRRRRGERNRPRDAAQSGEGGFIFEQCNAVLIGGTGVGKSHLAIAIARSCVSVCISGDMANECARRNAMIPRPGPRFGWRALSLALPAGLAQPLEHMGVVFRAHPRHAVADVHVEGAWRDGDGLV